MAYGERTRCSACGAEIIQVGGGHRQRQYCNDSCKQRAYQARKEQAYVATLRQRFQRFTILTQDFLIGLTRLGDEQLSGRIAEAIDREMEAECIRQEQSSRVASYDVSLLDLGSQLGYPELHVKHPSGGHDMMIRDGLLPWMHFSEVAEGRAIRAAILAARALLSNRQPPSA